MTAIPRLRAAFIHRKTLSDGLIAMVGHHKQIICKQQLVGKRKTSEWELPIKQLIGPRERLQTRGS